tara:strand:- start:29 stop:559 length:531 start_codon:yes stop_codon:yes gene_type:complete
MPPKNNRKNIKNIKNIKNLNTQNSPVETEKNPLKRFINSINNSKYFAGIIMLMINIGSKYVTIELSKSQESYLKYTLGRQILIFSLLWMGTRDIVISLILTAVFVLLANYLFNEESRFCLMPNKLKEIKELIDTDGDGKLSEKEINNAIDILKNAEKNKKHRDKIERLSLMKEKYI